MTTLQTFHRALSRTLFPAHVIVAIVLSVLLSHLLHLDYPGWAALSSFAVMNATLKMSLIRAIQRVIGTLLGGGFGLAFSPLLAHSPGLLVAFCAITGGLTVWRASDSSWSYAWVLGTVTAMMVIAEAQTTGAMSELFRFALARVEEVMLGCALCVLTALAFYPLSSRISASLAAVDGVHCYSRRDRLITSLQGGVALALVTIILLSLHLSGFWQAMISVLALLILPPTTRDVRAQITQRMQQRFGGCMAATLLGLLLLPVLHNSPWLYLFTLGVGVAFGCHLQQNKQSISYFGRQFTVAWILIFVQESLWLTLPGEAMMRSLSILMAILVLALVIVTTRGMQKFIPAG